MSRLSSGFHGGSLAVPPGVSVPESVGVPGLESTGEPVGEPSVELPLGVPVDVPPDDEDAGLESTGDPLSLGMNGGQTITCEIASLLGGAYTPAAAGFLLHQRFAMPLPTIKRDRAAFAEFRWAILPLP